MIVPPIQWDFGSCNCKNSADSPPTSPPGCCAPSCVAPTRPRDRDPIADQGRSGLRRRRSLASGQNAGLPGRPRSRKGCVLPLASRNRPRPKAANQQYVDHAGSSAFPVKSITSPHRQTMPTGTSSTTNSLLFILIAGRPAVPPGPAASKSGWNVRRSGTPRHCKHRDWVLPRAAVDRRRHRWPAKRSSARRPCDD